MDIGKELIGLLRDELEMTGRCLKDGGRGLAKYAAARAKHLSKLVGQPGFDEALEAERDNVMMRATLQLVDEADAADARLLNLLHGALALAARLLVP